MTVTGGSVETVRFTVRDAIPDLRAHLAHGGDAELPPGVSAHVDGGDPDAAICYAISGEVIVSSNVSYDLLVSDRNPIPGLGFLTDTPASYAACVSGEPLSDSMFVAADPPGSWVPGQPRTRMSVHVYTQGLVVAPGDDPLATLGGASPTVLARPAD